MTNEVKVTICGQEYKLTTSESPNYVFALARSLETKINDLISISGSTSQYNAAIKIALSTMDDLQKSTQRLDTLRSKAKEYVDEAGRTRIERDAALKEVEALKAKVTQLENLLKLRQLKDSIDS